MEFFPVIDVSAIEAEAIARGLYTVAAVDGVHERELALISDFYREAAGDQARPLPGRIAPLEPQELAALLPGRAHRELFLKAALLLAWADGSVSAAERTKLEELARALAIAPGDVAALEAQVKDYLLRPLAHLTNVEAATKVARKLGV